MYYLTRMLGKPVTDAAGKLVGTIQDFAIATGEVFPRVTALAFVGPDKTPFMLSWRKYVDTFDAEGAKLTVAAPELRFSYLQPDEVLLSRDLLNKQIVDTQGMKVVRVNDLKLSESRDQLRLLGAEVGTRGILRSLWPPLEPFAERVVKLFGGKLPESIIAWNYMDLLDRDLSHVKLSVTHKRLHELHPADVADILEQLSPSQRAAVFQHLDNDQAAEAISELEDELQAQVVDDLTNERASDILEIMDPDDAADIIGDLPYDKAETLLRLMGVKEARQVRSLLGYRESSAGGIMTPEVTTVTEDATVAQVIDQLRTDAEELESIYYIYVVGEGRILDGVVSLRDLIVASPETKVADIVKRDLFTVGPDDDQEQVAEMMSKYDLLALPVVDESGRLLGIVTVDDALEVMEQESAEDLRLATGSARPVLEAAGLAGWLAGASNWLTVWIVLGIAAALLVHWLSSPGQAFLAAALFLPLVVRISEDVTGHALGALDAEDAPLSFRRRLLGDLLVGLALGIVSGLIGLAVLQGLREPLSLSLALSAALASTIALVTALSSALPTVVRRTGGEGWRASSAVVSTCTAAVSIGLYLALGSLLARTLGA
jgi:magnesium transporter